MSRQAKRMAESLTDATTRRGFLGRLARVAGSAAAGVAAVLAAGPALGARPETETEMILCYYHCRRGQPIEILVPINKGCPKKYKGCRLVSWG